MKPINSWKEWEDAFETIMVRNPSYTWISTFGIGMSRDVDPFVLRCDRIIVGLSFTECFEGCKHCQQRNATRHKWTMDALSAANANAIVTTDLHLKAVISDKGCIVGGMNLSRSTWDDMSFLVDGPDFENSLKARFDELWSTKKQVVKPAPKKTQKPEKVFNWGKHKGATVQSVIKSDPQYIQWCRSKIDWFETWIKS